MYKEKKDIEKKNTFFLAENAKFTTPFEIFYLKMQLMKKSYMIDGNAETFMDYNQQSVIIVALLRVVLANLEHA